MSPRPVAFLLLPLGLGGSHTRRCEPRPSACVPLIPYRPTCALGSWLPEGTHLTLHPCFPAVWHRVTGTLCAVPNGEFRFERHEPHSSKVHSGQPFLHTLLATASCVLWSRRPLRSDSPGSPQLPILADHPGRFSPHPRCSPASAPKSFHLQRILLSEGAPTLTAPLRRAGSRPVHTWTFGMVDPVRGRPGKGWVPTALSPTPRRVRPLCLEFQVSGIRRSSTPGFVHPRIADMLKHRHRPLGGPRTRRVLRALPRSLPWPPQGPFPGPGSSSPGHPPPCPVVSVQDSIERGSQLQGLAPLTSPLRLPAVSD